MLEDGLPDPNGVLLEAIKFVVNSAVSNYAASITSFRVARQSDERSVLSHQDQADILNLYGSTLRNPKVKGHLQDFDPLNEVSLYLDRFHERSEVTSSCEQIFVLAYYQGHVVSYIHGSLRGGTFFLWYLIGPGNLSYSSLKEKIKLPPNMESMHYSESLVMRLLTCLCNDGEVSQLVFAVGNQRLRDPHSNERSRIRLFSGLEDRITSRANSALQRAVRPVLKRVDHAFAFDDEFVQPMINQGSVRKRSYTLVCIPLSPKRGKQFRVGSVPYAYYREILDSIYPVFYEFHEEDESVSTSARQAVSRLLEEKDLKFRGGMVPVIPMRECLEGKLSQS